MKLAKRVPNSNRIEDLLQVYMQPVFDIDKFSIVKAEALVRSRNTIFGKRPNDATRAFELIRKNGWYYELDNYVLKTVCEFIETNKQRIKKKISVNLCKETIEIEGVAENLARTISKYDIDKSMIAFEINEKTNFDSEIAIENMKKLDKLGIELILDDFGFGDTSLIIIGSYNISTVKLDKIFLKDLNDRRIKVVKEMLNFLDNLGIKIIIEGVEKKEQLDIIRKLGKCNVQGYLLGKPVDMETYLEMYTN